MIDDGTGLVTIGRPARATGLTMRTIRHRDSFAVLRLQVGGEANLVVATQAVKG